MVTDSILIFVMGAMVGQILLVIGLNLWEWWEKLDDPEPPSAHPDTRYWDWDPDTQTYVMRGET